MAPQKTLGRYRVLDELGRGAMGAVYRAVDPLIEREVALKTLLPDLPPEIMAEVRERFLREARSAGRLSHPNIVTVFDVGEQDGVAYIAMELLEGRSLQQMLRAQARLPAASAADIAAQVADALDHAQQFRIVHRDVKPANVMIAPSGRCKLTDFGIAYVPTSTMTQTGEALGSPRYMSPEQVAGVPVDGRSDIFSLGVVLYEMLVGRNPFERETDTTPLAVMHRIAAEPHTPVRQIDPTLPAAFDRILARALAKKPQDRYGRAAEMAAELRRAAGESANEKTLKLDKTVKLDARNPLLNDLDDFVRRLEREEEELRRA
ncbi:MAG TPA: serine/threonine-protein kinase, partial [Burkholderiales bacterium]|nr:serine/threonine-protein kinase [Burkholderiales bacterium]